MSAKERKDKKIDTAGDQRFPASDAPAHNKPTGTEPPSSREDIERAQRGDGRK